MLRIIMLFVVFAIALPAFALPEKPVVREDGKVYIKDIPRLEWGKGQDCTYMGALAALARHAGDDVTYDYLMGVSGMAFRVQKWANGWCPSAACVGPGYETHVKVLDVLGYKTGFPGWYADKSEADKIAGMREAVMKSIDRGYPVIFEDMDNGLIVGYSDNGNKLIYRSYSDKDGEYSRPKQWPWYVMTLEEKGAPMGRKKAVRTSMEIALEEAGTPKFGDYYSGWAAYESWIADLLDEAKLAGEKDLGGIAQANRFMYAVLADGRVSAVRYLRSIQNDLGYKSKPHILKAAGLYEQIAKKLDAGRKHVPGEGKPWTKEMREVQASVLKDVVKLEKKAVAELKAALEAAE